MGMRLMYKFQQGDVDYVTQYLGRYKTLSATTNPTGKRKFEAGMMGRA
jgi:hypothetical protein